MSNVLVEVLSCDGCPHAEPVFELVERLVAELGLAASIVPVVIRDSEAAAERRFLGSPSVRVNHCDIEPGADERSDYVLSCRLYRSAVGLAGQPDEQWLREALLGAA